MGWKGEWIDNTPPEFFTRQLPLKGCIINLQHICWSFWLEGTFSINIWLKICSWIWAGITQSPQSIACPFPTSPSAPFLPPVSSLLPSSDFTPGTWLSSAFTSVTSLSANKYILNPSKKEKKCREPPLLTHRWMELSVLSPGVRARGYSESIPWLLCWRLQTTSLKIKQNKEWKKESCHTKYLAGPSRTLPDCVFSPPLESQLQAWHINFFSTDLLVSFLPECVNHKLIYEGNF